ncbi:hypothetical protein LCGC14_2061140 [marine sediment metagenome]|uniref:DUF4352 domain-containing protein n=1 Tax=marine sediment metagenome TaxID=412755 RepID=A0A0F9ELC5_9ZZZZ
MASKNSKTVIIIVSIVAGTFIACCVGIMFMGFLAYTTMDVEKLKKEQSVKVEASSNDTEAGESTKEAEPKKFKLGQSQQGDYWKYVPKKIKRTDKITGDFGTSKSAGSGQEYILLYITVQNITNKTQTTDFTFDPQPVLLSGKQEYKYDWDAAYNMKESERFKQNEDVAPEGTESGWLLFKIPTGKKGFKLKIEDFVWSLGM